MKDENKASERGEDVKRGHPTERVSGKGGVEKVGGPTGVRFGLHDHPDKSVVTKGKLAQ